MEHYTFNTYVIFGIIFICFGIFQIFGHFNLKILPAPNGYRWSELSYEDQWLGINNHDLIDTNSEEHIGGMVNNHVYFYNKTCGYYSIIVSTNLEAQTKLIKCAQKIQKNQLLPKHF